MMAWGMWKARYWAVLGFQMLLVLLILARPWASSAAPRSSPQVVGSLVLLPASGVLFYYLIRAMARIQMPERPG